MSSRLWKPWERSPWSEKSFPHCLFLEGEDMTQQTDGKLEPTLSPQSTRTSGNQGHNCWEGLFSLLPPTTTLQTFTPTFTRSFSAELELLLRGRKVLKRKIKKNPIRGRSASNKFKSPNDLPLQTSGAWQHLDDLLREQVERCVLIWKPALKSGGSSQSTKPSFLTLLPSAFLFVSLSFSGKADSGDLDLEVNAVLRLTDSNISPEFCLCLSYNSQTDNVSFLLSCLVWPSPCFKRSKSGLKTGKRNKAQYRRWRHWKVGAATLLLQTSDLWHGNTEDQAPVLSV